MIMDFKQYSDYKKIRENKYKIDFPKIVRSFKFFIQSPEFLEKSIKL